MSMSTRVWIESEQITNTALEMIALQLFRSQPDRTWGVFEILSIMRNVDRKVLDTVLNSLVKQRAIVKLESEQYQLRTI